MTIRRPARVERISKLNRSLNQIQSECEDMLATVLSAWGSEHRITKRAVDVCRQVRRLRGDLDQSLPESSIHRIK